MDDFDASLKKMVSHLTHDEFVRKICSTRMIQVDMAIAPVYCLHQLRKEFHDEMFEYVFRSPSGV